MSLHQLGACSVGCTQKKELEIMFLHHNLDKLPPPVCLQGLTMVASTSSQ
jgi:hypothetical protein